MTLLDIPDNATIRKERNKNVEYLKAYWRINNHLNTRYIGRSGDSLTRLFKLRQIAKKSNRNIAEVINNMNIQLRRENLDPENDTVFDQWLDTEFLKTFGLGEKITSK